uniref:Uncharacterized protein n=1 Tax=Leersia perrieri TaxID=77586 RepID=A0A0D9W1X0_9ORYZ
MDATATGLPRAVGVGAHQLHALVVVLSPGTAAAISSGAAAAVFSLAPAGALQPTARRSSPSAPSVRRRIKSAPSSHKELRRSPSTELRASGARRSSPRGINERGGIVL